MAIKAITFDLWDTLFIDGSDEKKRSSLNLKSKKETRYELFHNFVNDQKETSQKETNKIFDTIEEAFNLTWKNHSITWTVKERLTLAAQSLNIKTNRKNFDQTVEKLENMELDPSPSLIPGVLETLTELKKHYKLGIISDTIYSPGKALRKILEKENILNNFSSFVFSDELGYSKPKKEVFHQASSDLSCNATEMAHIGDRFSKDIKGAKDFGAKAILCLAAIKREPEENVKYDAYFSDYKELPALIYKL